MDKKYKRSNELLAKYLIENGLIEDNDIILEYVRGIEHSICINTGFEGLSKIAFSGKVPSVDTVYDELNKIEISRAYYLNFLASTFSDEVFKLNDHLLLDGVFNFGIASDIEEEYTESKIVLVKYEEELLARGISVNHYEDTVGDNHKLLVLKKKKKKNG